MLAALAFFAAEQNRHCVTWFPSHAGNNFSPHLPSWNMNLPNSRSAGVPSHALVMPICSTRALCLRISSTYDFHSKSSTESPSHPMTPCFLQTDCGHVAQVGVFTCAINVLQKRHVLGFPLVGSPEHPAVSPFIHAGSGYAKIPFAISASAGSQFSSCFFFFDDEPFFLLCDALLLCLSLSSANGTSMTCALVCECDLWPKPDEDFFFPKAAKMLSPSVLTDPYPWLKLTRIKEDKMANMTNPLVAMRDWWRNEFTKPRVDFFLFPSVMSFAAW